MFSPRKPIYAYKAPPYARPALATPFSTVRPCPVLEPSPSKSFPPGHNWPHAPQPSSPEKKHPVHDLFGDLAYAKYRAGLGFLPTPPSTPQPNRFSTGCAGSSPASPHQARQTPYIYPGASPAESARLRAARARAAARVNEKFRNARAQSSARRPGRSSSWLSKEERKRSRLSGDSFSAHKRREERKRTSAEEQFGKRVQEEQARKLAEEVRRRAESDRLKADEARRATGGRWEMYVAQWEWIMGLPAELPEHEMLTTRHLPFPLAEALNPSLGISGLSKDKIESFLLDRAHSEGKSRRDRVRAALLTWHPDKSEKWICKFREDRRPMIREVVGIIARYLTEMMAA